VLTDEGLDAGAHTIAYHLTKRHGAAPSVAAIWRILSRRGFLTPPAAEATAELVRAVRGPNAKRALAGRHHPLASARRHGGGDLERDRRSLPGSWWHRTPAPPPRPQTSWRASIEPLRPTASPPHCWAITERCSPRRLGVAGVRSRSSSIHWQSPTGTRARITPRPAARSSASTSLSSDGSPGRRHRRAPVKLDRFWSYYKGVRPHRASAGVPPPRRSQLGRRRRHGCRGSSSRPTSGSDETRSTPTARSRLVTTRGFTTSG
jgi:hypothetical protein